jgi:hypothetical protein
MLQEADYFRQHGRAGLMSAELADQDVPSGPKETVALVAYQPRSPRWRFGGFWQSRRRVP